MSGVVETEVKAIKSFYKGPIVDYKVIVLVAYLTALPGFIKATKGLI